jgi:dinuclear metal center YbgI/SA1388 family protein
LHLFGPVKLYAPVNLVSLHRALTYRTRSLYRCRDEAKLCQMRLSTFIELLEQIAPTRHAEPWDNVGLLVGDPQQDVSGVMLTIDYTSEVACEAAGAKCDAIVAYHPPIFEPIKCIVAGSLIFDAIRRGVAIYSPHTALDVAEGGTNDVLADILELGDRKPLKLLEPKSTRYKLVTFVPEEALEKVSCALFDAGAGQIGNYSSCSFRIKGSGTFFGEAGTNPTVGQAQKLERVDEVRLETIVPIDRVDAIVSALRRAHPYEEPAFDLNQLAAPPQGIGQGRVGRLPSEVSADMLINRIKRELKVDYVLVAGDPSRLVRRAAVCAGACGKLLDHAIAQRVDFYLTGEMRHHDALKAASAGITVVCTLHSNSERLALKRLRDRLAAGLPGLAIHLSQKDRDPFAVR